MVREIVKTAPSETRFWGWGYYTNKQAASAISRGPACEKETWSDTAYGDRGTSHEK